VKREDFEHDLQAGQMSTRRSGPLSIGSTSAAVAPSHSDASKSPPKKSLGCSPSGTALPGLMNGILEWHAPQMSVPHLELQLVHEHTNVSLARGWNLVCVV